MDFFSEVQVQLPKGAFLHTTMDIRFCILSTSRYILYLPLVNDMLTYIHILFTICLQMACWSQTYESKHSWYGHPINRWLLILVAQPMLSLRLWDAITNPLANQETWHHSPLKLHQIGLTHHTSPKKDGCMMRKFYSNFFSRNYLNKDFKFEENVYPVLFFFICHI